MKYNELKTEEYVVSFIDILGAAKKIKENADDSLNQVHNVYTNSLKYLEEITQIINVNNKVFVEKLFIRIFSDNIVIAASAKESVDIAFLQVVAFTAIIQQEFLQASVLVRGGISIGNFYYDDVMIWGKALVEAYTVESTIAIYPRVVITPELIDKLKFRSWHGIDQFITVDMDGLLFVDYISNHYFKKLKVKN